ncbi:mitochondrial associated ribonuclease [Angomonas deanei]|nr:mitochondrial associated ribonuclease [Angomonas deanei]|eukprot:EPY43480.1 mitochondrial associated ribonuclease [Angomonas deanei]
MVKLRELLGRDCTVFLATEHYPEKLGHTAGDIQLPDDVVVSAKYYPTMLTADILPYIVGDRDRGIEPVQQVVLWGHETHVCVIHTADELLQRGIRVAVAVDGCAAQKELDHSTAVLAMSSWDGLLLSTTGSICMQLSRGDERIMKSILDILKS